MNLIGKRVRRWHCALLLILGGSLGVTSAAAAESVPQTSAAQLDIIPAPAEVQPRAGVFALRPDATISHPRDPRAVQIASYFAELLLKTQGMRLRIAERAGVATAADAIIFRLDPSMSIPDAEGYEIDVSATRIMLSARDSRGLFYAAVTLWELCTSAAEPGDDVISLPAMRISDSPRFSWRGLMLDSARHYQSPDFIMSLIDWMALHKLNVLQWHLTDDQAWRLEIRRYPKLTSVGAWRVPAGAAAAADIDPGTGRPRLYGGFYTQEVVRRIVAHAAERSVTIVPEVDVPGHASAAIVAYPWLGVTDAAASDVPSDWGVYSNLLSPEESTFEFLGNVLNEVVELFPGEFVHLGGGDAPGDPWKASARVQARMRQLAIPNEVALQGYFMRRMEEWLRERGRRLVGWDEILQSGAGPGATVMSRRGIDAAVSAARSGHDTVLSPLPTLSFDHSQGDLRGEPPGQRRIVRLEDVYRFDPMPPSLDAQQAAHVLGLQANVWTEHIRTSERIEYLSFPRAAAVAEVGWSRAGRVDWGSFVQRLRRQLERYRTLGIHYSPDAFAVKVTADLDRARELAHVTLSNQTGFGEIHYTLDGSEPTQAAALYSHPVDVAAQGQIRAAAFHGGHDLPVPTASRALDIRSLERRSSHQLQPCSDRLPLAVEDDAPVNVGPDQPRAVFSIDVLDPCWRFTGADLTHVTAIQAAVGQVPFNFRVGADRDAIHLNSPRTPAGELEVRSDGCDGPPIAVLPLDPAIGSNEVTVLPPVAIRARPGRHDLCLRFTQRRLDPLWAIDWVQLVE